MTRTRPFNSKPSWLTRRLSSLCPSSKVHTLLQELNLATVCREAKCPNSGECFSRGTATFLILGRHCTRTCGFCAVSKGKPKPPDPDEPRAVAKAVRLLGLSHVVITSVTRDDLPDGGACHYEITVNEIRNVAPSAAIELLIPDFQGSIKALETVVHAAPDIIGHNMETVQRLYPAVRPEADYSRSLSVLKSAKDMNPRIHTKSGLMLGLGETLDEVRDVFLELRDVSCSILTLGQYLQPSRNNLPVQEFVTPELFEELKYEAINLGFRSVASGPYVRSSYHAEKLFPVTGR